MHFSSYAINGWLGFSFGFFQTLQLSVISPLQKQMHFWCTWISMEPPTKPVKANCCLFFMTFKPFSKHRKKVYYFFLFLNKHEQIQNWTDVCSKTCASLKEHDIGFVTDMTHFISWNDIEIVYIHLHWWLLIRSIHHLP